MDFVFLEVAEGDYFPSKWIVASKILFFGIRQERSGPQHWVVVEAPGYVTPLGIRQYEATPWLDSRAEAEAARRQLIQLLAHARPTQVVRWKGSAFVCEDS